MPSATHTYGGAQGHINGVSGKQPNFWVWRSGERCGLEIQVGLKVLSSADRLLKPWSKRYPPHPPRMCKEKEVSPEEGEGPEEPEFQWWAEEEESV